MKKAALSGHQTYLLPKSGITAAQILLPDKMAVNVLVFWILMLWGQDLLT